MPAAAPDDAPRPRLATWLLAGAVVAVVLLSLLAFVGWWIIPYVRPRWVLDNSTWPGMAVHTALVQESRSSAGVPALMEWVGRDGERCEQLMAYLQSTDHATRRIVVGALAVLQGLPRLGMLDVALRPLLDDPDPDIRQAAAMGMIDVRSIPALEAHQHDPAPQVAREIEDSLVRLRAPREIHQ